MRQFLRLPFTAVPYLGWIHACLAMVLAASIALVTAGLLVFWPTAIPAPLFVAAAWFLTGAVGLLRPARRAGLRLANGLLRTALPAPLRPRRFATAAWLLSWTVAGGALAAVSTVALAALGLPVVWFRGGGAVTFGSDLSVEPGAAGAWTLAAGAGALVAAVYCCAGYTVLMRRLAAQLLGPGLAERLAAAEAEADRAAARNQLARDLHDSIGHTLTASTIQAAVAKQAMESDPESARLAMEAIEGTSRAALEDLDRALGVLRGEPASTRPEPTLADLDALSDRIARTGTELAVELDGDPGSVPDAISREAYRIVQEGVTNALRHAPGAAIRVRLSVAGDRLHLRIVNGLVDAPGERAGGRGLTGVTERVRVLGGHASAGPEGGSEWALSASLPLHAPARS
ncbi:sensor histidine kinase [Glycomyces terrestris]|uniref:histidine kinase n=1 Tax=Glycomyces terrestris TaxID=2493553 RepID=A0A426USW4_9ACTN|nr:histidine kinase [Glycomyces terrestris]RRR96801.1 two-component sensor histidine kinase [Glycomyces terrestris]